MPSSTAYKLIEPHPSVPNTKRPALHMSRGGAGNVISLQGTKTTDSQNAEGPASLTRLDSHTPSTFKSGRGGMGNVHSSSERAIFSFDEELERDMRREEMAPVFHVGRGGAGNMIYPSTDTYSLSRKFSGGSSSSTESVTERAKEKARRGLERSWSKLMGA